MQCPRCGNSMAMLGGCQACSYRGIPGSKAQRPERRKLAPLAEEVDTSAFPDAVTGRGTVFDGDLLPGPRG